MVTSPHVRFGLAVVAVGLVLAGGGLAPVRAAELPYAASVAVTTTAGGARAAVAADVNGDGALDVVTASADDDSVSWHAGDGAGGFGVAQGISAASLGAQDVVALDLDADGDTDVVVASADDGTIAWHENSNGDGSTWTHRVLSANAPGASAVFSADIDRDGYPDVLAVSRDDDRVSWFENPGPAGGAFVEHTIDVDPDGGAGLQGFSDGACDVSAADLDADGSIDVLVASALDDTLAWYRNVSGDGLAWTPGVITTTAVAAASIDVADPDRDGRVDVIGASAGDDSVAWHENSAGDGSSWVAHSISSSVLGARGVAAADLDADGDDDILSAAETSGAFAWHENSGGDGSTWIERGFPTASAGASSVLAADLDGDGDLDALNSAAAADTVAWFENRSLHRSAAIDAEVALSLDAVRARGVFSADLDADGDLDVLSASEADDKIAWYENLGSGGFAAQVVIASPDGAFGVSAGDLDRDGDVDVLSASLDGAIAWYPNTDGMASFGPQQLIAGGALSARTVVAADLDRDGDLDALSASKLDDKIAWYENTAGDASAWTTRVISLVADGATQAAVADIDGDGALDVLSASQGDDKIAWYENDGASPPGFTERVVTADPDGPGGDEGFANGAHSVSAGDVDGDGDLDLFSASANNQTVAWYENVVGDGSAWISGIVSANTLDVRTVYAVDVDADGDVDVLSASKDDFKVAWHENAAGDGSLWVEHAISTDANKAYAVYAADLDGDGDLDALSASRDDGKIAWYENRGGQFALPTIAVAPQLMLEGESHVLLAVDAVHAGRAGDSDLELSSLELEFERSPGVPLANAEAAALVARLDVHRDDGSGSFETGVDGLVASLLAPSLTPGGVQTVSFVDGDPGVQVPYAAAARFFVVVTLTADAASQTPNVFRIAHGGGLPESVGEDREADLPLALEFRSEVVAEVGYIATLTSDFDADGLLDVHETGTGVFVSPMDTGSDPFEFDTDADGVSDGDEVAAGTDPNQPPKLPSLGTQGGLVLWLLVLGVASRASGSASRVYTVGP